MAAGGGEWARELVARMCEEAREGGLRWAPAPPRLRDAPGLDKAVREDVLYLTAHAEATLDLAHLAAARRELERLRALARW